MDLLIHGDIWSSVSFIMILLSFIPVLKVHLLLVP